MTPHIGASKISTLLGLNPWQTPRQLFDEMTGAAPKFTGNAATRRGNAFEFAVVELFRRAHPEWLVIPWEEPHWVWHEFVPKDCYETGERGNKFLRHKQHPWLSCTPDAVIFEKNGECLGVLECKTTSPASFKRDWTDRPPAYYVPQVQQQCMILESILGYPVKGYLAGLAGMDESLYAEYEIPADDAMRESITDRADAFCSAVDKRDFSYWYDRYPDKAAPEAPSSTQTTPPNPTPANDGASLIRELKAIDRELSVLAEKYDAVRGSIEQAMKAANVTKLTDGADTITWDATRPVDYEAAAHSLIIPGLRAELESKYTKIDFKKVCEGANLEAKALNAYRKTGRKQFRCSWKTEKGE